MLALTLRKTKAVVEAAVVVEMLVVAVVIIEEQGDNRITPNSF
jgi:hypothetical protein